MKDKDEKRKIVSKIDNDDFTFEDDEEDDFSSNRKDLVKKIREDLKTCRKDKEEYLTGWQRAKADYINLQKELDQIRVSSSILARENFVLNLLPVIDSFDMAFDNKKAWEKVDKEWRIGIEYIHQQFKTSLLMSGVEQINEINISFDPKIHDSVKMINTKKKEQDGIIAQIIQIGYRINDRIIRPARVNVYKYKE